MKEITWIGHVILTPGSICRWKETLYIFDKDGKEFKKILRPL